MSRSSPLLTVANISPHLRASTRNWGTVRSITAPCRGCCNSPAPSWPQRSPARTSASSSATGKNRSGYVTRLNEAGKYTLDEASRICERDTDRMWPCEQIDALAHPTVDMQHLPRKTAKGETK